MILCVVMLTAITVMFVAGQEVMMASVRTQTRVEQRMKANYALESIANFATSEFQAGLYTPSSTRSATIAGLTVTAQVTDYDFTIPKTLKKVCSVSIRGQTYNTTHIRGKSDASPWNFALWVADGPGSSWSIPYSTGNLGVNGDAYIGKSATIASSTQVINGDLESDGPITPALFSATGTTWSSAPAFAVLTAPMAAYAIAGNKVVISPFSDINGYAFPAESAGTYRMLYKVGDVIITGNFTGSGLIVATGDVTLYGPCSVSGGRIVVVAGDQLLLSGTAPINAYVYAKTVYHQDELNNLIGAIVCQQMGSNEADCNVTYDPYLWNNPGERVKLRMPGHWP